MSLWKQTKMETCIVIIFSSLTWTPQGGSVRFVSLVSLSRMWILSCLFYTMKPITPNAQLLCASYILLYWKGEGFWSHSPYVDGIYINKIISLHITYIMHNQAAVVLMVTEQDCYLCNNLLLVFCISFLPVDLLSTNCQKMELKFCELKFTEVNMNAESLER